MFKLSTHSLLRLGSLRTFRSLSSTSAPAVKTTSKSSTDPQSVDLSKTEEVSIKVGENKNSGLVAAVFASLNTPENGEVNISTQLSKSASYFEKKQQIDDQIEKAQNVESLLTVAQNFNLSRKQSLKAVSILSEWSSTKKADITTFGSDPRFMKLCQTLGRQKNTEEKINSTSGGSEDLQTVLGVTGEDEAARLISSLTLPQMIKVISSLAQKKRRSTPLLRAISYHITKNPEALDLKKCADLFYAMASLNFPDTVLIDRVCSDIQEMLPQNNDKSSVIGSVATSLGILRYKDTEILDVLSDWMVSHRDVVRPQDVVSLVLTMAMVGYNSPNSEKLPEITSQDIPKHSVWLDYVWSLLVLDRVTNEQMDSVLNPEFINKLKKEEDIPLPCLKKLLNINASATLLKRGYMGTFLKDDTPKEIPLSYSKEKILYVNSLLETLKSLLSSDAYLKRNCNSRMGFLYDAECLLDSKCNPYAIDSQTKQKGKSLTKVAMLALDYHDICRQNIDPIGSVGLYQRLLQAQGYKVLLVPYTEFNPRDKLVNRVQYIERKLKETVQESSRI